MSTKVQYAEDQNPNYSGFVLIGAGLPRTGTMSTRAALGRLLDGACYHMVSLNLGTETDWGFWNKAMDGEVERRDWVDFLERRGFRAGVDYPISLFYRELMEAYPDAKVLLTTRDPVSWYKSVFNTIYQFKFDSQDFAIRLYMRLFGKLRMMDTAQRCSQMVPKGFEDDPQSLNDAIGGGEANAVEWFNRWNDEVRRVVPEDRLLVFEVKQGWQPLCDFLGLPVPDEPFPRVNDTAQMQRMVRMINAAAYATVYGVPVVVAAAAAGYWAAKKWM